MLFVQPWKALNLFTTESSSWSAPGSRPNRQPDGVLRWAKLQASPSSSPLPFLVLGTTISKLSGKKGNPPLGGGRKSPFAEMAARAEGFALALSQVLLKQNESGAKPNKVVIFSDHQHALS